MRPSEGPFVSVARFRRVFALVPDCHARHARYARLWRKHFYDGLREAVSELILPTGVDFEWARPAEAAPLGPTAERTHVSELLWHQIRAARADVVISYCFASDVDVGLVQRTIDSGVPWINFFCDSTFAFERVEELARTVSLNWFPECQVEGRYRALGRRCLPRPYAMNPSALTESICEDAIHDIGFVGAPVGNRVLCLAALRLRGCPVVIRGEGWDGTVARSGSNVLARHSSFWDRRSRGRLAERVVSRIVKPCLRAGGPLEDEELPRFVSQCRVVLGLNDGRDVRGRYRSYLKSRDIEFPGYGACYLTQQNDDIVRAFDVGREILTFRNMGEAGHLVRECVARPERARALGRAARRRVLADHTWRARLRELADAL